MDSNSFKRLLENKEFEVYPEKKVDESTLRNLLPKVNGIIIRSNTKMTKEFIDLAPNLKYIIRAGEGTDNIDKFYCKDLGIKVSNTPGANSNAVCEQAIGLIFSVLRKLDLADRSLRNEKWEKEKLTGLELTNKTLGVIGMGKIAQMLIKRLSGFNLKVQYHSLFEVKEFGKSIDLEDLFKTSDVITIHTPLDETTKNLVDYRLLSLMKPTAILINTARGGIVNEDDLYKILKEKKIYGAGLDVFSKEPIGNSKLLELDNIVLSPHLGASSQEAQDRVGEMAVNQMVEFFLNNCLLNEVKINAGTTRSSSNSVAIEPTASL